MAWYVNAARAPVDPAVVVAGGVAGVDVYRVERGPRGVVRTTLWARAGTAVSTVALRHAALDRDTVEAVPAEHDTDQLAPAAAPFGTLAARPVASPAHSGHRYATLDVDGGQDYLCNGTSWVRLGLPAAGIAAAVIPRDPEPPPEPEALAPADVAGRVAHYTAADLPGGDGSPVTSWASQVGDNPLAQATGNRQPSLVAAGIGGRPTVRFTDDYLDSLAGWVDPSQPFHLVMLARFTETGSHTREWVCQPGVTLRWLGYNLATDSLASSLGSALNSNVVHPSAQAHLFALAYDGATLSIRRDGVTTGSGARSIATTSGPMRVGANTGGITGGATVLEVAELAAWQRTLTVEEENGLNLYAAQQYGVAA